MNDDLKTLLQKVFNLSDQEFSKDLDKDSVSSWDSLRHMDLIATIEGKYGFVLTMEEILSMTSFDVIQTVLNEKGVFS